MLNLLKKIESIEALYRQFYARSACASPYLSYDWIKHTGKGFRDKHPLESVFSRLRIYLLYSDSGGGGDVSISVAGDKISKRVEIIFADRGIPFDPTARKAPKLTADAEKRKEGGLGIHIVKETMDQVKYEYLGGKNVLTVRKKIET